MVVGVFPVAKLGALFLKQISKPIANIVKERAKHSYIFRTYICMPPAQLYHWWEVRLKMWVMDLGKPTSIPNLNEKMAIELGANLLGEGIIFTVAAGILINEYLRSSRKEAEKEVAKLVEVTHFQNQMRDLLFEAEKQRVKLRELRRIILIIDGGKTLGREVLEDDEESPGTNPIKEENTMSKTDDTLPIAMKTENSPTMEIKTAPENSPTTDDTVTNTAADDTVVEAESLSPSKNRPETNVKMEKS